VVDALRHAPAELPALLLALDWTVAALFGLVLWTAADRLLVRRMKEAQ